MADQTSARLVSISAAFLLSGYGIASSQNILPLLYELPPSTSTTLFKGVFQRGLTPVVMGAFLSISASTYLAYSNPRQRSLHVTAALLPASALLMTRAVMIPGIERLIALSMGSAGEQAQAAKSGEVLRLLKVWTVQNWVRASLYLTSGMVSLWSVLST